jgi:hypothetical protein
MRQIQLFLILFSGGLSVYVEFRNITQDGFLLELLDLPYLILSILTAVLLIINCREYRKKKAIVYFPSIVGLLFIGLITGHILLRSHNDKSQTLFTGFSGAFGDDGGFIFDFKKNNHLVGKKFDFWHITTYRGSYRKKGDTVILSIPLDFKMGRQAVMQDSFLYFIDDTISFEISQP